MKATYALVITLALASGCLAGNPEKGPLASTNATPAASPASPPMQPLRLFLGSNSALADKSPSAGYATLGEPVSQPFFHAPPAWSGTTAAPANLVNVSVEFWVTSNSASVNIAHWISHVAFIPTLPDMFVELKVGNVTIDGNASGPLMVMAGMPVHVQTFLQGRNLTQVPAGTKLTLSISPVYTHVEAAAEFRVLYGGSTPSAISTK
jgi:hypothetical protein